MISPECIGFDLGAISDAINRAKLRARPSMSILPRSPSFIRPPLTKDRPRRHIPCGTGPYTVGLVDIMSSHSVHGTFIRIFYPTEHTDIFERQLQWPLWLPRKQYIEGYMMFKDMHGPLLRRFFNWLGGDVYVPALWQAPVLKDHAKFPVIVFSHGMGANRTTYSTVCLDLASHGFVVAAVEHRDGSASMTYCLSNKSTYYDSHPHLGPIDSRIMPDVYQTTSASTNHAEQWLRYIKYPVLDDFEIRNKQLDHRVKEVSRAVDLLENMTRGEKICNVLGLRFNIAQFTGRLDLSHVAIVGHSFGGATTVSALANDERFQVGVALDAWMLPISDEDYKHVTQPLMFINTETFQWKENVLDMLRVNVNEREERKMITIRGTCHQSVTDFQFLCNPLLGKFLGMRHTLAPQTAMDLNNNATKGFLWKHLGVASTTNHYHDDLIHGQHPLVILGSNLDLTSSSSSTSLPSPSA